MVGKKKTTKVKINLKYILIGAVIILIISFMSSAFNWYEKTEDGYNIPNVIENTDIDLWKFVSEYKGNKFEKIKIIWDDKMVWYELIGTGFLMKSNAFGENIYKSDYNTYTAHKPINTSIVELGIVPADWNKTKIQVSNNTENIRKSIFIDSLLPLILFWWFALFLMSRMMWNKWGWLPFGMKVWILNKNDGNKPKTTFKDVAGMEEVKDELVEIVDFLKNPKKYKEVWARIPKWVLLYWSPWWGKTLLARAVAGEANVPFYSASGSEFMEMLVGMWAAKVRELFGKAKSTAPSIIFIDEIDAIGKRRWAGHTWWHQEQEQTLNQILTEMDWFEKDTSVIVIAATNRPDTLDPALLRSGRFDRKILVTNPTLEERIEIINYYLKNKKIAKGVNLESLAKRLSWFVWADIENIINEAALKVAKDNRKELTAEDFEYGFEKSIMWPEKKIKTLKEKERKIVTYHELWHAIVSHALPNTDPVEKISIVSRGMALGVTWIIPEEDSYLKSKAKFLDDMAWLLWGRAAEEVFWWADEITTWASNDFEKVTKMAFDMVVKYGMYPEIGTLNLVNEERSAYKIYSEKTSEKIDELVKKIVSDCYEKAKDIIVKNKDKMIQVADILYTKEYLNRQEFEELMGSNNKEINSTSKSVAKSRTKKTTEN